MEKFSAQSARVAKSASVDVPSDSNDFEARFRQFVHNRGMSAYYTPSERKAVRRRCKLTQKEMAFILRCRERTVSRWEHGADLSELQQLVIAILDHLGPKGFVQLKEEVPGRLMWLMVDSPLAKGDAGKLYAAAQTPPDQIPTEHRIDTRNEAEREEAAKASDLPDFRSKGDVAKLMSFRQITVSDLARYTGTSAPTIRKWRNNNSLPGKVAVIVLKLLWNLGPTEFERRMGLKSPSRSGASGQ